LSISRPLVAVSPLMTSVLAQVARAATTVETVLLLGESGTGKELLARSIHASSARAEGPFVAVNCGALPEGMVEAILFGHERGAFSGAVTARKGRFVEAHGGTLFLDEIGEIAPATQVKLLRALQEREVEPLGGQTRKVDVRVVAATNRDLAAMMRRGQFREDLFYRLDVVTIRVPPLRERREDIPPLVRHFLTAGGRAGFVIDADALERIGAHGWPGNVRQLENFVKKLLLASDGARAGLAETVRLLSDGEAGELAVPALVPSMTQPGGRTRPASTTVSRPAGTNGLALAWWRFRPVSGPPGQPYACELASLESATKLEAVRFDGNRARIGRERGQVELALETGEVSRLHATIRADENGYSIQDEDSRNRTYVDGRALGRADRASLQTGTVVRIGKEWLGIALLLGPTGLPEVPLGPMLLARAFLAARGDRRRAIDIRALEALCVDRAAAALEPVGRALAAGGAELVHQDEALAVLPAAAAPARDWRLLTREELLAVVAACGDNKREAARRLGISPQTLYTRLKNAD
jgi:DNA-binding NtrC family response regulator